MRMRHLLHLLIATALLLLFVLISGANALEVRKSALYVFLHEVKPLEEDATSALNGKNYALALRKYREALAGYERIWKEYPDLPKERPYGIDRMVDESMATCKKIIDEIKEEGEAQDEFYQKLSQMIRIDFHKKDIRAVAKALTFLTDVNIIVDDTVFANSNQVLNPEITLRVDEAVPLRKIIMSLCEQMGLAYSIESDHIFISTRVKIDNQK